MHSENNLTNCSASMDHVNHYDVHNIARYTFTTKASSLHAANALKHFLIGQLVKFFLLINQSNASKHL